jgi:hypothetical protein
MKNGLMIWLDEIEFKQILYEDYINKHMELNKEVHQQVQDKASEDLAIKDSF